MLQTFVFAAFCLWYRRYINCIHNRRYLLDSD